MKNRVFIVGVEGSGTTMLSRILGSLPKSASVHGNYLSEVVTSDTEAKRRADRVHGATAGLWHVSGTFEGYSEARTNLPHLIRELEERLATFGIERCVYKRSAPFLMGFEHIPDLFELNDLFEAPHLIVMVRDPKASSASALKRDFFADIKQAAIACHISLTMLDAAVAQMEDTLVIDYSEFCRAPDKLVPTLAQLLGVDEAMIKAAIDAENIDSSRQGRYLQELDDASVAFLNAYFDERRLSSYRMLSSQVKART